MEQLREPRLAERTRNVEARSLRGCGARPASSAAARMGDYTEIFGGFASSCSIPVLVLPEVMDGYDEAFAESQSLNYLEIFRDHDAGVSPLSYEELVYMGKGSKEDGRTSEQSIVDGVKSTVRSSLPCSNYEPDFEDEKVSSTETVEVEIPKNCASDDHILYGYMEQGREEANQRDILDKCFVDSDTVSRFDNDPKPLKYSTPEGNGENLKEHSRSSSYHSASSGDAPFSDYSFLTISDINLHTQPLQVPPPSRAPPKLDIKQEMSKSEALKASNDKELIAEPYKDYHTHHVGVPRTRHALKETVKTNSAVYLNVEVDASSAAAASAAAMIEAMEQAQASLKSAKELMERKRDSPQSEKRQAHHDFVTWNEQNGKFTGRSRHKTKTAQKIVSDPVERANSVFSENIKEPMQGKESRFNLLLDEKEISHDWGMDKQFYEIVGNEKLMRNRAINDEKHNNNEFISLDRHGKRANKLRECQESHLCGEDENDGDDDKEPNGHEKIGSGSMDFYGDSKLEQFDGSEPVGKTLAQGKECDEIHIPYETDPLNTYGGMAHSRKAHNSTVTSESTINKKFDANLSSLQNANAVEVDSEYKASFSSGMETNFEDKREECRPGNKARRETFTLSYSEGNFSEMEDIDNTFEKKVSGSISDIDKSCNENEKELKLEQRAKLNMPNESKMKVNELPQRFENYMDKLTVDGEQREGEIGNVQAALELEKKIEGLNAGQQVLQRKASILNPSVEASESSKQMEKNIRDEWRDANYTRKEISYRESKEAELKRMLEEERMREREKDRIAVEKTTGEPCEKVFAEARERLGKFTFESVATDARHKLIAEYPDVTEKSSAKAIERSEKIANEAKLRAERAAVQRATAEARDRAIARAIAEQASLEARMQPETYVTISKDKIFKNNASEGIISPGDKNVYDAPVDMKSQSTDGKGESPLRCKARQERHQRIVERAAKALAEKNMRDLIAQKELADRNRLAESLDVEVRRWSSGKEGNLRALLSTLQYILGNDSGWQPIPLTEVITVAAVRKAYRKATLYVHPDKLQQRGASIQHKYICEKVFDLLKDAWNKFNSEGR